MLSHFTAAEEAGLAATAAQRLGSAALIWSQEHDTARQTDGIKSIPKRLALCRVK